MLNCAIVGATGYTGVELTKILLHHPCVRLVKLTTRQEKAIPIGRLIPTLGDEVSLMVEPFSFSEVKRKADLVFLCLPHTVAM